MKILLVDPAADWSTRDVYVGLLRGLRAHGIETLEFRSGRLLAVFSEALWRTWLKQRKTTPTKPSLADAAYLMSERAVTWALRHEPDWVVVVSGMYFHPDALILLKRAGFKTAVLLTESPYDFEREAAMARLADVVWTIERTAVEPLRAVGVRHPIYLPHAWDPGVHFPDAPFQDDVPVHDVLFIGTGFRERVEVLRGVDWRGLNAGLALYGAWGLVKGRHPLRAAVRGGIIPNQTAASFYRRATINLNLFRKSIGYGRQALQIHGAESIGPRAYELAALGCFFLSEPRAELREVFGDLVPTFGSSEELADLVRRWLPDVTGRQALAAALPAAVRGHTWTERAAQVISDLRRAGDAGPDLRTARDAPASATGEPLGTSRLELV